MGRGEHDGRDQLELRQLVEAYALAADHRDAGWFTSLWLPDARLEVYDGDDELTGTYDGADAMAGVTTALGRYRRTVHLVSTHRSDVSDDTRWATGETYCTAHHLVGANAPPGASPGEDRVMTIRYDDRYGRDESGSWRFAARRCHKLWVRTDHVTVYR